ncbi:MAG TPA: hypothetical protein VJM11_10365 [Nevskiaceae bacterium]|nr:hypothetical protein [Nevskiaceae bacterium]
MINSLLHAGIARFEKAFGYDMGYGHEMLDVSRSAFLKFAKVTKLSQHREGVPAAVEYAAKLAATLSEDCGPCTQLVVGMAEKEGVPATVLRGIIEGDVSAMGADVALGWRFARAVLAHDLEADPLREEIAHRWGRRAVVSLALSIAASRMYPTVKYAMGHGRACARVKVGGVDARPLAALATA